MTETQANKTASVDQRQERERSTIEFPYGDLDSAVRVVQGVHKVGGTSCADVQLAAELDVSHTGGAFRVLLRTTKVFGLVTYGQGSIRLTDLGSRVADPTQEAAAKIGAFLAVPLYKALYDKYKGVALPPHLALESEMATLGVAKKSTNKARQPFQRSAKQAGFFASGQDRLVSPHTGNGKPDSDPNQRKHDERDRNDRQRGGGNGGGGERHDLIEGLIKKLPPESSAWATRDRYKWLQAANTIFDLIYENAEDGGSLRIEIEDSAE